MPLKSEHGATILYHWFLRKRRSPPVAPARISTPGSRPRSRGAGNSCWGPRTEPSRWRLTQLVFERLAAVTAECE
jgi:hypothetical protein